MARELIKALRAHKTTLALCTSKVGACVRTVFSHTCGSILPLLDARALMGALGLCASEAKLTALLAGGASLECAAEQLGISVNTARTQIKKAFEKTDTHSQGQLIALVSQLISPSNNPFGALGS